MFGTGTTGQSTGRCGVGDAGLEPCFLFVYAHMGQAAVSRKQESFSGLLQAVELADQRR